LGKTAIEEALLARDWLLLLPHWDKDWSQRLLWRWFTPRERVVAKVIFPVPLEMVRPWMRILRDTLLAVAVWQGSRLIGPRVEILVGLAALFILLLEVLVQCWPTGVAFRRARIFGVHISLLAPYPLTVGEISRVLLKCTLFQLPIVAMVVCGLAVAVALSHGFSCLYALDASMRMLLVFLALRAAMLVLNFCGMSNDTSRSWWRTLVALAICVAEILVFAGLAILAILPTHEALAWGAAVALAASQLGFLRFYAWLWNRGSIDMMSVDAAARA
jgi:hypothetical protein